MTMQMQKATGRGIQSVEVGYRVLNAVQAGPGALTLKEIASRAKLTASAAHNYLVSLGRIGLVQSDRRGAYRLGPSATALGLVALKQADLFESVRAEAMNLYEQTGVGVVIMIWSDLGPVIVFKKEGIHRGAFDLRNGHVSMLTTGGGNIFVTYLDDKVIQPVAVAELKAQGRPAAEWKSTVAKIRDDVLVKGFAARNVDPLPGFGALSAPVWDTNGTVHYTLTLIGPSEDLDYGVKGRHVPHLLRAARRASRLLGADAKFWSAEGYAAAI